MYVRHLNLPLSLRIIRSFRFPRKIGVLERIYGKALEKSGVCWVLAASGFLWKLDLGDPCDRWLVFGEYEGPVQMAWIRRWLGDGGLVLDSGANRGQMAQYFAANPEVKVVCVEPVPSQREWLIECINANRMSNIEVLDLALGSREGQVTIRDIGARSTLQSDWYCGGSFPTVPVNMTTVDSLLDSRGSASIRLWKLDVEGFEAEALRGAKKSLSHRRIDAVLLEVNPERLEEIRLVLNEVGYSLFAIEKAGLRPLVSVEALGNVVALPSR